MGRVLQITWETEPIGQHYLRKVLTIFKFELNLFVAGLLTMPGSVALGMRRDTRTRFLGLGGQHCALRLCALQDSCGQLEATRSYFGMA